MATEPKLSHTAAMILQTIHAGQIYGFSVMEATGLPSGTVYPAMRRLERDGLIVSKWEQQSIADAEQRPLRKYYKLTRAGRNDPAGHAQTLPATAKNDLGSGGQERMSLRLLLRSLPVFSLHSPVCRVAGAGPGTGRVVGGVARRSFGMYGSVQPPISRLLPRRAGSDRFLPWCFP